MNSRNRFLVLAVLAGLVAPAALADAIFTETDFDPATWTADTPFLSQPAPVGLNYGVSTARFNADFLLQQFDLDVPAGEFVSVYAPVMLTNFVYDPATDGEIDTISAAVRTFPATASVDGGFGVMRLWLEQGGKYYVLSANSPNFPTNYPEMAGFDVDTEPELIRNVNQAVVTDFVELTPGVGFDEASHPDFAGGPIQFGFGYSMTSTGIAGAGQHINAAAFDDVSVRISVVPEPASALLLAAGALALLRRR